MADNKRLDASFRALAHRGRRTLLIALNRDDGQTLSELCYQLAMTRQGTSRHLAILEAAQLIKTAVRGREKVHYLNRASLRDIAKRWFSFFGRQGEAT